MASTVLPNGIIVPEKFSRDWYADLYHNWQELDNLLGGGTPKDGTLTIQKNGDTVGTFSANQATDETVNIEVPTATSELTNDSGFITGVSWNDVSDKPTFATVATSGSYNDLSNKPTIPTVNDATLTIQKNGTTINTFTANSSADKTVNISVPTNTSELTNGAGFITADYAVPRSGGAVLTGQVFARTNTTSYTAVCGGTAAFTNGGEIDVYGADSAANPGCVVMRSYPAGTVVYFNNEGFWCINELQLGKPDRRWGQIYSTSSSISTSDSRLKNSVKDIDDALLDAWGNIEPKQYKFNDATEKKGEKARYHTGYLAQDIQAECEKQGVNASDYGLFCYDEWEEQEEVSEEIEIEKDGKIIKEKRIIQPRREKGDRYSLRYEEALVVECMYLRRCIARLTARIEEFEKGNNTK